MKILYIFSFNVFLLILILTSLVNGVYKKKTRDSGNVMFTHTYDKGDNRPDII